MWRTARAGVLDDPRVRRQPLGRASRTPTKAPTTSTSASGPASRSSTAPSSSRMTAARFRPSSRASSGRWPASTAANLSAKVFAGQCRLIEIGYRQGGPAGFGLRRMLVDDKGAHKGHAGSWRAQEHPDRSGDPRARRTRRNRDRALDVSGLRRRGPAGGRDRFASAKSRSARPRTDGPGAGESPPDPDQSQSTWATTCGTACPSS